MSRPELSLCMIFRDEEAMLPDFIEAVDGLWDEFVAVDTGSEDRSVEILEKAGAKVHHFPWCDDFAAARNASVEQATGRWILFLDADERPSAILREQIRNLMADETAAAATVVMRNQWPDGTIRQSSLLRLFRNDPDIRFRHRIHEDVSDDVQMFMGRTGLGMRHLDGVVDHLGYTREVAHDRDKKERDLKLLRLSLESEPRDFYCWFKIMEIARFWDDQPLWRETATQVAGLLKDPTAEEARFLGQREFSGEMAALVAQGLPASNQERLSWLEGITSLVAPHGALDLRHGLLLEDLGRLEEAASIFHQALARAEGRPDSAVRPRLALCRVALARGDLPAATAQAAQAAALNPFDPETRLAAMGLAESQVDAGEVQGASDLLEPLAPHHAPAALGYLLCCLCLGRDLDLQVDVEPEEASALFQGWIRRLWNSRQIPHLESFADACGSVVGVFPWLPDFLQEETVRLSRQE